METEFTDKCYQNKKHPFLFMSILEQKKDEELVVMLIAQNKKSVGMSIFHIPIKIGQFDDFKEIPKEIFQAQFVKINETLSVDFNKIENKYWTCFDNETAVFNANGKNYFCIHNKKEKSQAVTIELEREGFNANTPPHAFGYEYERFAKHFKNSFFQISSQFFML